MKENEKNFLKLFHNNLVGMILTDEDHVIVDVNDKLLQLVEMERKEVIGKTDLEINILNEKFVKNIWQEFDEKKIVQNREISFKSKNNNTIHCLFSTEDIDLVGKQLRLTTLVNISKRKKAEDKVKESELRFKTLTKNAPVGIFETDANGLTTYVNETWMQFTGMGFKEALGEGWLNAIHPDDRKALINFWYKESAKAETTLSEYRLINKIGKERWVVGKAIPVINEAGVVTGYIGTISDVSEIKRAMHLLQKSEEALNKAQHISKIGNWEFSLETGELSWSKEQYRIFELEGHPSETLYAAYRNKYHPDDLLKLDEVIKNAVEEGEGFSYEHRIICNNGNIKYILGIGEVIVDAAGKIIGIKGTGQDITAQKLGEQKLQERTEQLKELSTHLQIVREEERTSIAREIHDELGQQLTGLKMDIAWLMKKVGQEDQAIKSKFDDALTLIDSTVKSIRRIATELRPSIIDDLGLNAALEWLVSEFTDRLGVEIQYENNFDDKNVAPEIAIGLFRILQESLTNIAKHASATKILISIIKERNAIRLLTEDNGIGFDCAAKPIQLTFGLLGIKERTHMLKGEYSIFTKPGKGTKIEIKIPL